MAIAVIAEENAPELEEAYAVEQELVYIILS
jgi:hypothetical protein